MIDALPMRLRRRIQLQPCPVATLESPCWYVSGSQIGRGYRGISVKGRTQLAHRFTYTLLIGPIPDGLQIDHLCRNRPCCNPAHLEPVTNLENALRSDRATRTHCIRGHELSGHNLIIKKPGDRGRRQCRKCVYLSARRSREARRLAAAA